MSKNRDADQQAGRFTCRTFGGYGYEWFHVLRILELLVPEAVFSSSSSWWLSGKKDVRGAWLWEVEGIRIEAASNIDGIIGIPDLNQLLGPSLQESKITDPTVRFRRILVRTTMAAMSVVMDQVITAQIRTEIAGARGTILLSASQVDRSNAVVPAVARLLSRKSSGGRGSVELQLGTHKLLHELWQMDKTFQRGVGDS